MENTTQRAATLTDRSGVVPAAQEIIDSDSEYCDMPGLEDVDDDSDIDSSDPEADPEGNIPELEDEEDSDLPALLPARPLHWPHSDLSEVIDDKSWTRFLGTNIFKQAEHVIISYDVSCQYLVSTPQAIHDSISPASQYSASTSHDSTPPTPRSCWACCCTDVEKIERAWTERGLELAAATKPR
ncbi:hypothetical protein B0H19DRAFT_1261101 [Mycena capillaripes]|nr:hypothetical protein B0H19DRAFT_1261101 [Mycena capillaripes]